MTLESCDFSADLLPQEVEQCDSIVTKIFGIIDNVADVGQLLDDLGISHEGRKITKELILQYIDMCIA